MDKYYDKLQELEYYFIDQEQRKEPNLEDLMRLENKIDSPLPEDYKNFLIKYGLIAFGIYVLYPLQESCPCGDDALLSVFFGFSADGRYDIEKNLNTYNGRMPSNFLPIASDPGGNMVLLSISGDDRGKVYYWDHEHRELLPEQFKSWVSELKSKEIDTEQMSTDKIILRWQQENKDKLNKPPGYSNIYLIADNFAAFFEALEADDEDDEDDN